jgi:hypothetical protein
MIAMCSLASLPRPRFLAFALTCGLALGIGCSPRRAVTQTPEPDLCSLDGGKWCRPCESGSCPVGSSGWLCCSGGYCVAVATTSECNATIGWCSNYTTQQQCNNAGYCVTTAVCHDEV